MDHPTETIYYVGIDIGSTASKTVILDETGILFYQYGIQAYPTTFMIDADGNLFGFVRGAISREIMDNIIKQTMEGKRE